MKFMPKQRQILRQAARQELYRAIRVGEIVRQKRCDKCGMVAHGHPNGVHAVYAHHRDYSKPLEVDWLCHSCHKNADEEIRKRIRAEFFAQFA